jgi:hypothetical protein
VPVPNDLLKRLNKYKMDNPEKSFVIGKGEEQTRNSSAAVAEKTCEGWGVELWPLREMQGQGRV